MKFRIKKDNLRSAVFIALSLILMASSLYVGLVKGKNDDDGQLANLDTPTYGLEDLVVPNDDSTAVNDDPADTVEAISDTAENTEDNAEEELIDDAEETVKNDVVSIDLSYPVSNDKIVMDYSYNEEPVYSKTFNEYRSDHAGIDIAAKEGEEVFSAAEGIVEKVYEDEKLGFTVVISHNGYETHYSNLDRAVLVKEGDEVTTDTALGRVGNSAIYESAEDCHVHFGLFINGECADPKDYL